MKKVKFFCSMGYVGCDEEEIMEYEDDDITDEIIDADFENWVWDKLDAN
jgi:hypothetical protein